jgi:LAO/AO transport system kinase
VRDDLPERVLAAEPSALARAISIVERGGEPATALLRRLHPSTGGATILGVTGPPGAGKSCLINRLIVEYRRRDRRVAVVAIDPTSAFSGGALLGDRVRMTGHENDSGVFIRSMATRGSLGGLAPAAADVVDMLDAAGFDIVVVETVGVGQDEIDIVRLADVCVVTLVPGGGDDVQAMKAGVMEIADVFAINKADLPGADRAAAAIDAMLALDSRGRRPAVRLVSALTGAGVGDLVEAVEECAARASDRTARRAARARDRLQQAMVHATLRRLTDRCGATAIDDAAARVGAGEVDPYSAAEDLLQAVMPDRDPLPITLDHVAIATDDWPASVRVLMDVLGLVVGSPEDIADQQVRVRFVETGAARIELVEPLSPASPIARFVARRGAGLHHVAVRVPDLEAALARLREHGVRLIDEAPRRGAHGRRVAFVHPSSANGVLFELVDDASRRD